MFNKIGLKPASQAIILLNLCCGITFASFVGEVEPNFEEDAQPLNAVDRSLYEDCGSLVKAGYTKSGIYRLYLDNHNVLLPCEFRDGKAFTIFLRRVSNATSFHRNTSDFVKGFGKPKENFWAGLNNIHQLTKKANKTLTIFLRDWDDKTIHLNYADCFVEDKSGNYTIHFGKYNGSIPIEKEVFSYHNNRPFTCPDTPHGQKHPVCAVAMRTGWWFNGCAKVLLTGEHYHGRYEPAGPAYDGIYYSMWRGFNYSLKYASMAFS